MLCFDLSFVLRRSRFFSRFRYAAVRDFFADVSFFVLPKNEISPPWLPGPGPISITLSAARIICGSCSTTSRELPESRSLLRTPITRSISLGCKPILGSSSTKRVLTSEVPSAVVRFILCTSPPLSVRDCLSSVRYPRPTSLRYFNRDFISSISILVASSSGAGSSSESKKRMQLDNGSCMMSCNNKPGSLFNFGWVSVLPVGMNRFSGFITADAFFVVPTRHHSASGFRRAPSQVIHGV